MPWAHSQCSVSQFLCGCVACRLFIICPLSVCLAITVRSSVCLRPGGKPWTAWGWLGRWRVKGKDHGLHSRLHSRLTCCPSALPWFAVPFSLFRLSCCLAVCETVPGVLRPFLGPRLTVSVLTSACSHLTLRNVLISYPLVALPSLPLSFARLGLFFLFCAFTAVHVLVPTLRGVASWAGFGSRHWKALPGGLREGRVSEASGVLGRQNLFLCLSNGNDGLIGGSKWHISVKYLENCDTLQEAQ